MPSAARVICPHLPIPNEKLFPFSRGRSTGPNWLRGLRSQHILLGLIPGLLLQIDSVGEVRLG